MIIFSNRWLRILLYMLIALSSAVLFRLQWFPGYSSLVVHSNSLYLNWLEGLGPCFGALILYMIKKKNGFREILLTSKPILDILFLLCPVIVFGIMGIENTPYINPHIYGVKIAIWIFIYGILEEMGWRGYLQQELNDYPKILKYLIVGTCWYIWHLTFLGKTTVNNELVIWIVLVAASYGIGQIYSKTASIYAATCFHVVGDVLGLDSLFRDTLTFQQRLILIVPCVIIWAALIYIHKKRYVMI